MKKIIYALAFAALMPCASSFAAIIDQDSGTENGVAWEYWNDRWDGGEYFPNWKFSLETALSEVPTSAVLNYELKQGETVVASAENVGTSNGAQTNGWTFYFPAGKLEEGKEYSISWKFTLTPVEGDAKVVEKTNTFTTLSVPKDYIFSFNPEIIPGETSVTVKWNFTNSTEKAVPENAVYNVKLGIPGPGDKTSDLKEGELTFEGLTPNTKYTLYYNNPSVTIDNVTYFTGLNTAEFTTVGDPTIPTIGLEVGTPEVLSSTTGKISYKITTDLPDLEGVKYHVWCNTLGDAVVGEIAETTDLEGTLDLHDLNANDVTELWVKAQALLPDGKTSNVAQFPGEPQGWSGLSIDTTNVKVEIVTGSNEPARYFNLQGVEVANPEKGLYIKVQGRKATKVAL